MKGRRLMARVARSLCRAGNHDAMVCELRRDVLACFRVRHPNATDAAILLPAELAGQHARALGVGAFAASPMDVEGRACRGRGGECWRMHPAMKNRRR
jgi:hypothetical protein